MRSSLDTFDYKEYVGKQIVLGMSKRFKSPQGMVDALSVSLPGLCLRRPSRRLLSEMMDKAKNALESGRTTISKISATYELR